MKIQTDEFKEGITC